MTENVNKQDIENDELICPITLQLFRDPVKAKDGHVYERNAITRWILQHGTSPLTREPLQINDLQSDEYIKNLVRQRRNSSVSYNSHDDKVTLPPIRSIPRNSSRVAPVDIINPVGNNSSSNKHHCRIIICIILCIIIPISIIIAIIFAVKNSQDDIISIYSGYLTSNNSMFNRTIPFNSIQYCYYDQIKISITKDGFYEFQSQSSIDMFAYFYQNNFNSTNIYSNLLLWNDDGGRNYQFYLRISLQSSINYILIATTYYNYTTGPFYIYVTGPATVKFN